MNCVIGRIGDLEIAGGASCFGVAARTAIGPMSETMLAASGSAPLRHSQPDFFFAGWCIGHSALPVWMHVHVTASAACGAWAKSDSGAEVSNDS
jgi:hypothetical protein